MNRILWLLGVALSFVLATTQPVAAGTVSGVVKDSSGTVLPNVTIEIRSVGISSSYSFSTKSGTNGAYSYSLPYAGYYTLKAISTDQYAKPYYYNGNEVTGPVPSFVKPVLIPTNSTVTIDPVISAGAGSVAGKATYSDGSPYASRSVYCYVYYGSGGSAYGVTDGDGSYVISGVDPSSYYCCYIYYNNISYYYNNTTDWSLKTPVVVTANTTTPNIDFTIPKETSSKSVVVVPLTN